MRRKELSQTHTHTGRERETLSRTARASITPIHWLSPTSGSVVLSRWKKTHTSDGDATVRAPVVYVARGISSIVRPIDGGGTPD
jgi:hypothetical protein